MITTRVILVAVLTLAPCLARAGDPIAEDNESVSKVKGPYKTFVDYLSQSSQELRDRFDSLKTYLISLGDDVQMKQLKYYAAFRRLNNFACVEVHPQSGQIVIYLKVDPKSIPLEPDFSRDVTDVGHYGTGDLEVRVESDADLEKAKPLILRSYEVS